MRACLSVREREVISALRFLSPMQYTTELAFYRFYIKGRSVIYLILNIGCVPEQRFSKAKSKESG